MKGRRGERERLRRGLVEDLTPTHLRERERERESVCVECVYVCVYDQHADPNIYPFVSVRMRKVAS